MGRTISYATVIRRPRGAIHVLKVSTPIPAWEIYYITERMRDRALSRSGEQDADVVLVEDVSDRDVRLFGLPSSVSRVRAELGGLAGKWQPIELD